MKTEEMRSAVQEAKIHGLRARVAQLEDALAPFAAALMHMGDVSHDRAYADSIKDMRIAPGITLDDLLLARDVLRRVE